MFRINMYKKQMLNSYQKTLLKNSIHNRILFNFEKNQIMELQIKEWNANTFILRKTNIEYSRWYQMLVINVYICVLNLKYWRIQETRKELLVWKEERISVIVGSRTQNIMNEKMTRGGRFICRERWEDDKKEWVGEGQLKIGMFGKFIEISTLVSTPWLYIDKLKVSIWNYLIQELLSLWELLDC